MGALDYTKTFTDQRNRTLDYVSIRERVRGQQDGYKSTKVFRYPRIIIRDLTGRTLDTFTFLQEAIYRAKANVRKFQQSISPEEWRLPHGKLPARPDFSRNAPPTAVRRPVESRQITSDVALNNAAIEIDVEDVSYVAERLQRLPEIPSLSFLRREILAEPKTYFQIVAGILLHRSNLSPVEKRQAIGNFPQFCSGCQRVGLCYGCDKSSSPHYHIDRMMKTGGGFTYFRRDRPQNTIPERNPANWKVHFPDRALKELMKENLEGQEPAPSVTEDTEEFRVQFQDTFVDTHTSSDQKSVIKQKPLLSLIPEFAKDFEELQKAEMAERAAKMSASARTYDAENDIDEGIVSEQDMDQQQDDDTDRPIRNKSPIFRPVVKDNANFGIKGNVIETVMNLREGETYKASMDELAELAGFPGWEDKEKNDDMTGVDKELKGWTSKKHVSDGSSSEDEDAVPKEEKYIPGLTKRSDKKTLYKAPKAFQIKKREKKVTEAKDPFSTDRDYDLPKGKGLDIKKSDKALTEFVDFNKKDSNYKPPKKFELKDREKDTTKFVIPKLPKKEKEKAVREHIPPPPPKKPEIKKALPPIERVPSSDSGLESEYLDTVRETAIEDQPPEPTPTPPKSPEPLREPTPAPSTREPTPEPEPEAELEPEVEPEPEPIEEIKPPPEPTPPPPVIEEKPKPVKRVPEKKKKKPIVVAPPKRRTPTPPPPRIPTPEPEPVKEPTPEPPKEPTPEPTPEPLVLDLPDLPEFELKLQREEREKKLKKMMIVAPPPLIEAPKKRKGPPKIKKLPKILSRARRSKPGEAPITAEELKDMKDPLDFLAKYCIINPDRLPYYELLFESYQEDQEPKYKRPSTTIATTRPEAEKTEGKEDQKDDGKEEKKDEKDADKKDEKDEQEKKNIEKENIQSVLQQTKLTDHERNMVREMTILTRAKNVPSFGLSPPEQLLEKLQFTVENLAKKHEKLMTDWQTYEGKKIDMLAEKARQLFPALADPDYKPKKKKKGKKGKKKKSKAKDSEIVTSRNGVVTNKLIVHRLDDKMWKTLHQDPAIRTLDLELGRMQEKLRDIEKRVGELESERNLVAVYCMEEYFEAQAKGAMPKAFRRQQSELYVTLHPDPDLEMNMVEVEDALHQINRHLLTEHEFRYLYHILGLTTKDRVNFRLFTIIAALSEKVTQLDPVVRKLINKFDYNALDVKMEKSKELFSLLDEDPYLLAKGGASSFNLGVELTAGGLKPEHTSYVVNKFDRQGKGLVDFLDFVTYVPLFIEIHSRIVSDPLNEKLDI